MAETSLGRIRRDHFLQRRRQRRGLSPSPRVAAAAQPVEALKRLTVSLAESTVDALEMAGRALGLSRSALIQRLSEWFTRQPQLVQAAIVCGPAGRMQPAFSQQLFEQLLRGKTG